MFQSISKAIILSAVLLSNALLFSMERESELTLIPLERREDIYTYLNDVNLCRFSQTSKENHKEIYVFKKRKLGIIRLKNEIRTFQAWAKKSNKTMFDDMSAFMNNTMKEMALLTLKNNWMTMTKQPWLIKDATQI